MSKDMSVVSPSESVTLDYLNDSEGSYMSLSFTSSTTYTDASLSSSEDASGGAGLVKKPAALKKPSAKPWQPPKRGKARSFTQAMKRPAARSLPYIQYVRHGNRGKTTRPSRVEVSQSLRSVYTASDVQLVKTLTSSGHLQDAALLCCWGAWGCPRMLLPELGRCRRATKCSSIASVRTSTGFIHSQACVCAGELSCNSAIACERGSDDVHARQRQIQRLEQKQSQGGHGGGEELRESTRSCACVDGGVPPVD